MNCPSVEVNIQRDNFFSLRQTETWISQVDGKTQTNIVQGWNPDTITGFATLGIVLGFAILLIWELRKFK